MIQLTDQHKLKSFVTQNLQSVKLLLQIYIFYRFTLQEGKILKISIFPFQIFSTSMHQIWISRSERTPTEPHMSFCVCGKKFLHFFDEIVIVH